MNQRRRIKDLRHFTSKYFIVDFCTATDALIIKSAKRDSEPLISYGPCGEFSVYDGKEFIYVGRLSFSFTPTETTVELTMEIALPKGFVLFSQIESFTYTVEDTVVETEYIDAEIKLTQHMMDIGLLDEIQSVLKMKKDLSETV